MVVQDSVHRTQAAKVKGEKAGGKGEEKKKAKEEPLTWKETLRMYTSGRGTDMVHVEIVAVKSSFGFNADEVSGLRAIGGGGVNVDGLFGEGVRRNGGVRGLLGVLLVLVLLRRLKCARAAPEVHTRAAARRVVLTYCMRFFAVCGTKRGYAGDCGGLSAAPRAA